MEFDPYYKWLGIPPQEQPAHHYRLLGISLFEADPEVIDAAYYRQMAYVRNCAVGPNSDLSQKILNELSAARVCLLDPKQKAAYDQELKARQTPAPPRVSPLANPFFKAGDQGHVGADDLPPGVAQSMVAATPAASAPAIAPPIPMAVAPLTIPMANAVNIASMESLIDIETARARPRYKARHRLGLPIATCLLLVGLLGLAAVLFKLKTADGTVVVEANVPNPEVYVDGNKVTATWKGGGTRAEITLTAGARKIELKKNGFKTAGATVEIEHAGRRMLVARLEPLGSNQESGNRELAGPLATTMAPAAILMGKSTVASNPERLAPPVRDETTSQSSASTPPPAIAPFDAKQARAHQEAWAKHLGVPVEQTNSIDMKLVLVPPGAFLMGSPETEAGRRKDEGPQHRVAISHPFLFGVYEVTQAEYRRVMGNNPSGFSSAGGGRGKVAGLDTSRYPVEQVSWEDATMFCRRLSEQEKSLYRLPTEAEWEYACRAGSTTQFSFGNDPAALDGYAWYENRSGGTTLAVGLKRANAFGLYDIQGNVYEWCQDLYAADYYSESPPNDPIGPSSGSSRVIRGGDWYANPISCRSAFRPYLPPVNRSNISGFRVVNAVANAGRGNPLGATGSVNAPVSGDSTAPKAPPAAALSPAAPSNPLQVATDAPPPAVAPFDAKQARLHQEAWAKHLGVPVEQINSIDMKLVLIPPGEFMMGDDDEKPQHRVAITKPYWLGLTEVTIGQFKKFVKATEYVTEAERFGFGNSDLKKADDGVTREMKRMTWRVPGYKVTKDSPVSQVTWNDAVHFCNWLSDEERLEPCYRQDDKDGWVLLASGTGYRLPTEAEWEYACRAGTATQFSFGNDIAQLEDYGWFTNNSGGRARAVGLKVANPFGLFDMHGNVWEWCHDFYEANYYSKSETADPFGPSSGSYRVGRGGDWNHTPIYCRSVNRNSRTAVDRYSNLGFRVLRVAVATAPMVTPTKPPGVTDSASVSPAPLVAPFDAKQARPGQEAWAGFLNTLVEHKNSVGMKLVLIPPGTFMMGTTPEQSALGRKMAEDAEIKPSDYVWARLKEEGPQHRVTLSKPYWLGLTEVTIGQFRKFVEATKYVTQAEQFGFGNLGATKPDDKTTEEMKKMTWRRPSYTVTDNSPVTQVTWNDAVQFCNWLSDEERLALCYRQDGKDSWILLASGTGYRLPTEAEWEYACRAGTTTQFSFGDDPALLDKYGWFINNSGGSARAVGLKVANAFGLFDMHGNAFEWCHDSYGADYYSKTQSADPFGPSSDSSRVGRGGVWSGPSVVCRSAYRYNLAPVHHLNDGGFRVMRMLATASIEGSQIAAKGPVANVAHEVGSNPDPIGAKLAKAKESYENKFRSLRDGVLKTLDRTEATAQANGDKNLVDQIKEERAEFQDRGWIPAHVPTGDYQRQLDGARILLETAYNMAIKAYTKAGMDDRRTAAERELTKFRQESAP